MELTDGGEHAVQAVVFVFEVDPVLATPQHDVRVVKLEEVFDVL